MKLSTGRVEFPIEFDNGDKDSIWFNPTDPQLAIRLKDFGSSVSEKLKAYDDMEVTVDGQAKDESDIEKFREMLNIIYEEIDKAFDSKISDVVFKYCSPLAIVDGDYFMMNFVNAIIPEIKKHNKKAVQQAEKKMEKHLAKYSK